MFHRMIHWLQKKNFQSLSLWLLAVSMVVMANAVSAWQAPKEAGDKKIEMVKLERVPPKTLEEAFQSIETLPEFEIELVAAEPLVVDPVAFAFDARGRLLVIEMIDYSEQDKESLGRLRRLEDTDQDGRMDRVETLAEKLSWPTALALSGNGVLVGAAPELFWFSDSVASTEVPTAKQGEVWATGFGRNNVQGLMNSFRWGLDQRWHATGSSSGGDIRGSLAAEGLQLRLQDFAIDTRTKKIYSVAGGGQHGMDFNPWGDKFVSSNSDHFQQILAWQYPEWTSQLLSRPVTMRRSMAADGPQAEVFRASPVEAWRTWRTELRVSGAVPGLVEGGGRAAGYFTGATGVVIYDGDQWPKSDTPLAFVADVGSNLIHRKRMIKQGLWWRGERMDEKTEFARSKDIWFRPVQLGDGPDGCLYVADMAREVIEHPASLPPMIKSQLDLTSGRDKGRIWRIRAKNRPIRRETPRLDELPTKELAKVTEHPNGWHRETAARLLYERNDREAISVLRDVAMHSALPEGRVQALASLGTWEDGIDSEVALAALRDSHPRVHQQVLFQLSKRGGSWKSLPELKAGLDAIAKGDSSESQFALALYLGTLASVDPSLREDAFYGDLLQRITASQLKLVGRDGKEMEVPELILAVEWAAGNRAQELLEEVVNQADASAKTLEPWIDSLLFATLRSRPTSDVLTWLDNTLNRLQKQAASDGGKSNEVATVLVSALERRFTAATAWCRADADQAINGWLKNQFVEKVRTEIAANRSDESVNVLGWGLLGRLPASTRSELLQSVLKSGLPQTAHVAAIRNWVGGDPELMELLLEHLPEMLPDAYAAALQSLAEREKGADLLLTEMEGGRVPAGPIPADVWLLLEKHPNESLATRAKVLRESLKPGVAWEDVAKAYRDVWDKPADTERGRLVFRKLCASCHRVGDEGVAIGPPLASILDKSNEQVAMSVFQPNQEVDPRYQMYQVVTVDGVVRIGVMESAQGDAVMIRNSKGELERIPRSEIEQLKASGKSLMPEGLLSQMQPEEFRDAIAFVRAAAGKTKVSQEK